MKPTLKMIGQPILEFAALGKLPRGLGAGEPTANDVDGPGNTRYGHETKIAGNL
ncbi:MAG: hypothetical protein ABR543_16305 [Gemmatimonadaceae bacterium]